MNSLTREGRVYFFACSFLWDTVALFHYLDEEVTRGKIGALRGNWSSLHENLAHWALEERWFPIESEKAIERDKEMLLSAAQTLGDAVVLHLAKNLSAVSSTIHQAHPHVSSSAYLYFYYCQFFQQILLEFDQILKDYSTDRYYHHYQESTDIFMAVLVALRKERSPASRAAGTRRSDADVEVEMDSATANLVDEWRQAVVAAARDLQLPDFIEANA